MPNIEIVKTPWDEKLRSLVGDTRSNLRVMSPYVKEGAVKQVLEALPEGTRMRLVSSFNTARFHRAVSDTQAFRRVIERGGKVRNYQRLHSKVYLFDDTCAVVTSGNLTVAGLTTNYEYGVLIREEAALKQMAADFSAVWRHEDTGIIDLAVLEDIDELVQRVPRPSTPALAEPDISTLRELWGDEYDLLLEGGEEAALGTLSGWQLDVFKALTRIRSPLFTLSEVYEFEEELQAKHPRNRHVKDKIRQQLQCLRERGLVKFLGGGRYKKLWD